MNVAASTAGTTVTASKGLSQWGFGTVPCWAMKYLTVGLWLYQRLSDCSSVALPSQLVSGEKW